MNASKQNPGLPADDGVLYQQGEMLTPKLLQQLLEALPDSMFVVSPDETILACNSNAARRLGAPPEEIVGSSLFEHFNDSVARFRRSMFRGALESGEPVSFEDGRDGVYFDTTFLPLPDADGTVSFIVTFAHEITRRHLWEEQLKHNHNLLNATLEATEDGILVVDRQGRILFANQRFHTLWLIPETLQKETDAVSLFKQITEQLEEPQAFLARLEEVLNDETIVEFDTFSFRDGRVFERISRPLPGEEFINGRIWNFRNVTKRKRAEKRLLESEANYRSLFANAYVGIFRSAVADGRMLAFNDALPRKFGYDDVEEFRSEFRARDQWVRPEEREQLFSLLREKGEVSGFTTEFRKRDGTTFWTRMTARIDARNGWLDAIVEDISEHLETEASLRQSEMRYEQLFREMNSGFALHEIITDEDGRPIDTRFIEANTAFLKLVGIQEHALCGKSVRELNKNLNQRWLSRIAKIAEEGGSERFEEYVPEFDRYFEVTAYSPSQGQVATLVLDVTERKQAEFRVRQSEERYRALTENISDITLIVDRELKFTYVSPSLEQSYDYTVEDLLGRMPTDFILSEFVDGISSRIDKAWMTPGESVEIPAFKIHAKHGGIRWLEGHVVNLSSLPGVEGMVFTGRDITERLSAEKALRESEERYRQLVNGIGEGIAIADENEVFRFVNPMAEEIFGLKPGKMEGRKFLDFVHPDQLAQIKVKTGERRKKKKGTYEVTIVRPDGEERLLLITAVPQIDKKGKVTGSLSVIRDLTEQRTTEQSLKLYRERLELHIEQTPLGVIDWDLEFRVANWNPAAERIFGYSREEAMGRHATELILDKKFIGEIEHVWQQLVGRRGGNRNTNENLTKDGTTILCDWYNTPLVDDRGDVIGVSSLVMDVTEQQRAEESKRRLEAQIQHVQKLESLGVLAGGIAHDFNNLLMAILGNTDLALGEVSHVSPARGRLEEIEKASRRAADLCQQMLAYSGKGRFVVEPLDLTELVKEMAHILEVSITKKAILRYNFADNLPPVNADPTQMRQVVMNLITNASEAIGDRSGIISLSTGVMECDRDYLKDSFIDEDLPSGTYVFIEVSDTGCGMDQETRSRLFDPFFTTKFTGRGLGLSAVLGIIRGHKGAIRLYSQPGMGSTFEVLFPAGEGIATNLEARGIELDEWHGTGTVLLVDDDLSILTVGKAMLERLGFDVLTAADGEQAVRMYEDSKVKPVCSILDLTMPRMDGEQAFVEIRRMDPKARVIISSGYNEIEVTQRFPEHGLAGFLQKPYRMNNLIDQLKEVLGED